MACFRWYSQLSLLVDVTWSRVRFFVVFRWNSQLILQWCHLYVISWSLLEISEALPAWVHSWGAVQGWIWAGRGGPAHLLWAQWEREGARGGWDGAVHPSAAASWAWARARPCGGGGGRSHYSSEHWLHSGEKGNTGSHTLPRVILLLYLC